MSQVITGARGHVKINGAVVGFVGGVNVTVEDTLTDIDVLGLLETGDLAETGHKCNFSINFFKAVDGSNAASNIGVAQGETMDKSGSNANGVATPGDVQAMRSQTYFDVDLVIDEDDAEKTIFALRACKWEGGTVQMDARGVWQGTWNFRAKRGFGL